MKILNSFFKIPAMKLSPFLVALLWGLPLWGGTALPLSLRDLVRNSPRIFVGRCVESSPELDEHQIPSLWVRYEVREAVRGVAKGQSIWLKEIRGQNSLACRPGEEAFLFLYGESQWGFTSAVGLGQGRFEIQTGPDQVQRVVSRFPHLAQEVGEMPLSTFLHRVQRGVPDEP